MVGYGFPYLQFLICQIHQQCHRALYKIEKLLESEGKIGNGVVFFQCAKLFHRWLTHATPRFDPWGDETAENDDDDDSERGNEKENDARSVNFVNNFVASAIVRIC